LSYCAACVRKCYSHLTPQHVALKCPKCRGICNCRACLRREAPLPTVADTLSDARRAELYAHLLRKAAAPLFLSAAAEREEVAADEECAAAGGAEEVAPAFRYLNPKP